MERAALDLMSRLLQYDPEQRLTAADAMRHAYFRDMGPAVLALAPGLSGMRARDADRRRDVHLPRLAGAVQARPARAAPPVEEYVLPVPPHTHTAAADKSRRASVHF